MQPGGARTVLEAGGGRPRGRLPALLLPPRQQPQCRPFVIAHAFDLVEILIDLLEGLAAIEPIDHPSAPELGHDPVSRPSTAPRGSATGSPTGSGTRQRDRGSI